MKCAITSYSTSPISNTVEERKTGNEMSEEDSLQISILLQMSIGLLSVTASVYQMLRGAEMLFAALFSVTILKR